MQRLMWRLCAGLLVAGCLTKGTLEVNYWNLVGSYLTATSQLNLAVGREVIQ